MKNKVSVIIPTTADPARSVLLRRAIDSASPAQVIVVVNGSRFDPLLVDCLRANAALTVLQRDEGNVSAARLAGLDAVMTPFFCFLDDDDELLPGAIKARFAAIRPEDDILVTNGFLHDGNDSPLVPMPESAVNVDQIGSFLNRNWFASPAGMFRTATVPKAAFDIRLKHFEWTWLFFRLQSEGVRMRYSDDLTYRVNANTGASASKSDEYERAYAPFLRSLLSLPNEEKHRRAILRKYHAALNAESARALRAGAKGPAWAAHAKCLKAGGWRYAPFTRHLLMPWTITRAPT